MKPPSPLSPDQKEGLLSTLEERFHKFTPRHEGMQWPFILEKLNNNVQKLQSLNEMENTGGEPDVVAYEKETDTYVFMDCSPESPKERRSLCYDLKALESRKEHKPRESAVGMAEKMGIELLTEEDYRQLQSLGQFDLKTSSWVKTPEKIRSLGGALFCDRRYDTVFLYHNGAESYYASRGFRGILRV